MAFRPVDMQIMTPRMVDLSMMHQAEKERPLLEQLQMTSQQNKQIEKEKQVVRKTSKDAAMKNDADAKDKGKNSYTYHPSQKKKQTLEKEEPEISSVHLDVKI
ncbi:MAG: hypothetical protein Q4A29_03140 [Eubacteriales bacterium]|nr:hypothetical protein [Eubacteriales bacterium]